MADLLKLRTKTLTAGTWTKLVDASLVARGHLTADPANAGQVLWRWASDPSHTNPLDPGSSTDKYNMDLTEIELYASVDGDVVYFEGAQG